jgi:hypothetical protein
MVLSNEVYTGAGLSATMIPETDYHIGMRLGTRTISGTTKKGFSFLGSTGTPNYTTIGWDSTSNGGAAESDTNRIPVGIYKGCLAEVTVYPTDSATPDVAKTTLVIKNNTAQTIEFNQSLGGSAATDIVEIAILGFGTPISSPSVIAGKHNLLSDNWLGLVNTITPPTVDAEMKQINLALGGTRNFGFQYKGAESYGNASLDLSLNNGSWLYYVLGNKTLTTVGQKDSDTLNTSAVNDKVYFDDSDSDTLKHTFHRRVDGTLCPSPINGSLDSELKKWDENKIEYTFTESQSGDLPSFALEITNEKGNIADTDYYQDANDERLFSRIYTGCQVNTFTMNFEEGQEVKATIDALTRRGYDSLPNYTPKRKVRTPSSLFNYNAEADNLPFMFSDGTVKAFGQTLAKVKSGSLTINNNITAQRYIGNYDRSIISAHTAAQRTYEVSLTLQVSDRTIWDELRSAGESTLGDIELTFDKNTTANTDKITITLADYLIQSVDIPFPEDKGMLDVTVALTPRTLSTCKYYGKWVILG